MDKEVRRRLVMEDHREEKELRGYVVSALAAEMGRMNFGGRANVLGEEPKAPAERISGTQAWREARGEAGNGMQEREREARDGR